VIHELRCIVHSFNYGYDEAPKGVVFIDCPVCAQEAITELRKHLKATTEQRDTLLSAISIKRLVVATQGERQ
jgi:hypothetical protein